MCADGAKKGEGSTYPRWCGRTDKLEMYSGEGVESAETHTYIKANRRRYSWKTWYNTGTRSDSFYASHTHPW